jgi:hypothetical protein
VEKDRTMWFSMWFLASIVTFGLAFFPMFYRSLERRNRHFQRQYEWEKQVSALVERKGEEWQATEKPVPERNAKLWTASIILVIPVFAIAYLLSRDLLLHEKHQQAFLNKLFPEKSYSPQKLSIEKYSLITVATLGVGIIYWLYKILNIYNNHFIEHRKIENEISRLVEAKSHGEPV